MDLVLFIWEKEIFPKRKDWQDITMIIDYSNNSMRGIRDRGNRNHRNDMIQDPGRDTKPYILHSKNESVF